MRWDQILAYILVTCGVTYASYSGVQYYQKLQVVQEIQPSKRYTTKASIKNLNAAKQAQGTWVIYPREQRPAVGKHFANLIIPHLNAKIPIIEGTDEDELAQGVGHFAGSVLPGEPDNAVLSGHRDTVFRRTGLLKKGDQLQVETSQGTFIYQITKMWITRADDRTVIVPYDRPILTLTTCYPFSYIGPAPKRYIIQSELIERIKESSLVERGG